MDTKIADDDALLKWTFLVKGPKSALESLPPVTPWWELEHQEADWEARILDRQDLHEANARFDAAQRAIVRMNGLAASFGQPALIEMTHIVTYRAKSGRSAKIPLQLVIKVTNLGGFGPTKRNPINFTKIHADDFEALDKLMEYWGQPNAETYEGFYKIYEWIQEHDAEVVRSIISDSELKRMKRSCNHWTLGPTTRHARKKNDPPADPMSVQEMRTLIRRLSNAYVEKLQSP